MSASVTWPSTSSGMLGRLRTGDDPTGWQRFWNVYGPVLIRFCQRQGLQPADAEDVVQKVILDVTQRMPTFEFQRERGRFRNWLATIAVRAVWKHRRRTADWELRENRVLDRWPTASAAVWEDMQQAICDAALDAIQPEFSGDVWDAFQRIWSRGESSSDVAAKLGRPVGWVYKAKFSVLNRLQAKVKEILDDVPVADH